jgi:hypothetical protein
MPPGSTNVVQPLGCTTIENVSMAALQLYCPLSTAVVQYLPNFFFGALLTVFGIEIAGDWLIRSYEKVRPGSNPITSTPSLCHCYCFFAAT